MTAVIKKICTKCKIEKDAAQFYKCARSKTGLQQYCKKCTIALRKPYRAEDYEKYKEKKTAQARQTYLKNREAVKLRTAKYRLLNIDKIKEQKKIYDKWYRQAHLNKLQLYQRKYCQMRAKVDVTFKLTRNLRSRLWDALNGKSKAKRTMELIGCSIDKLKQHLESQFRDNMSWDNYGKWHIDHIKPCVSFDLAKEAEQLICFNYTNLQPLWAIDNLKKSDKYE